MHPVIRMVKEKWKVRNAARGKKCQTLATRTSVSGLQALCISGFIAKTRGGPNDRRPSNQAARITGGPNSRRPDKQAARITGGPINRRTE